MTRPTLEEQIQHLEIQKEMINNIPAAAINAVASAEIGPETIEEARKKEVLILDSIIEDLRKLQLIYILHPALKQMAEPKKTSIN